MECDSTSSMHNGTTTKLNMNIGRLMPSMPILKRLWMMLIHGLSTANCIVPDLS